MYPNFTDVEYACKLIHSQTIHQSTPTFAKVPLIQIRLYKANQEQLKSSNKSVSTGSHKNAKKV